MKQSYSIDKHSDVLKAKAVREELRNHQAELEKNVRSTSFSNEELELMSVKIEEVEFLIREQAFTIAEAETKLAKSVSFISSNATAWTIVLQIGSALFGLGILNVIVNTSEKTRVRSSALIVLGIFVLSLLLGRWISVIILSGMN